MVEILWVTILSRQAADADAEKHGGHAGGGEGATAAVPLESKNLTGVAQQKIPVVVKADENKEKETIIR